MEFGLFGLQPEASSSYPYCLILRADSPPLRPIPTRSSVSFYDFGPFWVLIEQVLTKNMADTSILFNIYCLSDKLLVSHAASVTVELTLDTNKNYVNNQTTRCQMARSCAGPIK